MNVNGNISIKPGSYISFGTELNDLWYGFKDDAGKIKMKNLNEWWKELNSISEDGYINFTSVEGENGIGLRYNNATNKLQFKNILDTWKDVGSGIMTGGGTLNSAGWIGHVWISDWQSGESKTIN